MNLGKRSVVSALVTAFLLQSTSASAIGLLEAYESALQNDPTYQSAIHDNEAGQQNKVLGRSYLLPSLSASYAKYKNRADITQPILGHEVTEHPAYSSSATGVTLRQPLFNLDGVARYNQGVAQTKYSDAVFTVRAQDLLQRLMAAYADAKYAEDQLALATAQRDTFAEQRKLNERMFEKGEGTKTDVLETQSKYELAEAQVIEARDNLTNFRNSLAIIVGAPITQLDTLSDDFRVKPMQPASFEEWKALALEQNSEIAALRYGVEVAEQEVKKNRAGHAPRVDFIAALNKSTSETLSTLNQDSTTRTLGVQVNIPLYSGGAVNAATSQAVANLERAKSDLEGRTRQILVDLRKQYDLGISSVTRIDALVKSVESSRLLVKATAQSIKGGVRVNLDLLNAQQQLYTAQRDLAQARYNYLLSFLRLRYGAGTLTSEDLRTIAGYFVPQSRNEPNTPPLAAVPQYSVTSERVVEAVASKFGPKATLAAAPIAPKDEAAKIDATNEELIKLLSSWTRAWSAKDVTAYLAFYADDFQPSAGMSRAAWKKSRRERILVKDAILVRIEAAEVKVSGETAMVQFKQIYKAGHRADKTQKVLELAKQDGIWKIRRESVAL